MKADDKNQINQIGKYHSRFGCRSTSFVGDCVTIFTGNISAKRTNYVVSEFSLPKRLTFRGGAIAPMNWPRNMN
jgi:hypothetical protein